MGLDLSGKLFYTILDIITVLKVKISKKNIYNFQKWKMTWCKGLLFYCQVFPECNCDGSSFSLEYISGPEFIDHYFGNGFKFIFSSFISGSLTTIL